MSFNFVITVYQVDNKFIIYSAEDSQHTKNQKIKLSPIYLYSVLEVVDNEDEDRCKKIDSVHDWKRKIELCCSNG